MLLFYFSIYQTVNLANDKTNKQLEIESNLISIKDGHPTHDTGKKQLNKNNLLINNFLTLGIDQDDIFLQHPDRHVVYELMLNQLLFQGVKLSEKNIPVALQAEWSLKPIGNAG